MKESLKKISAILTTYNGEKTVEKTIESILGQEGINTDFLLELIVVDDSSSDNTFSILQKYHCILLKNEENSGGPNKGRNKGLKMASGDYLCICDQDDIWVKDKIISMLPYLEKAPIITSGYHVIDRKNNREFDRISASNQPYLLFEKNETFLSRLSKSLSGQNTYLGSLLFHKSLKNILFEEHFGMVDFDWILKLFHGQTSIEICKSLYVRIVENKNLSLNDTYRKREFYYSLLAIEDYRKEYPKETMVAYKRIHGSRARYYYLLGDMKQARFYFYRSEWNFKTLLYIITSFAGHTLVKKRFHVFG
jgi:glycosyltransferase involved in cell wall biosynthesis